MYYIDHIKPFNYFNITGISPITKPKTPPIIVIALSSFLVTETIKFSIVSISKLFILFSIILDIGILANILSPSLSINFSIILKILSLKFIKTEKLLFLIATLTFLVTSFSVNTTCGFVVNQPKIPEKAKKLRKF